MTTTESPNCIEHTDRGPLDRDELAARIARDIPAGSYVNLGIGQPTLVADHLSLESGVVLHTENGMLGMGGAASGADVDPDLINAGKIPVTETLGASYFHHADSFAMMRGGHLDVCVLGAFQCPRMAIWPTGTPGARRHPRRWWCDGSGDRGENVFVMMNLFAKDGVAKLVPECTYPLTGLRCVRRVYTDYAIFDIDPQAGVRVRATFGIGMAELASRMAVELH